MLLGSDVDLVRGLVYLDLGAWGGLIVMGAVKGGKLDSGKQA